MSANKSQVLLVCGALILSVLLFIAPKTAPAHSEDDGHDHSSKASAETSGNLEAFQQLAVKQLDEDKKATFAKFNSTKLFDSLAFFWDKQRRPDLASFAIEKKAMETENAEDWLKAGNRYYYSVQFTQDKTVIPLLYQSAMRSFGKVLKLRPENTEAKIMLASCYVEGSSNPMEGISMLREIEKKDSNNVQLQLSFAFFSVRSGQLEKAIQRFEKVLRADSTYIEAYLHLAGAYEQLGETEKTIKMLQQYSIKTTDAVTKSEIDKYIQQLKK
jgi:predicted Zn-dependent protease